MIAVSSEKAESKDRAIATPAKRRIGGATYYHVTTPENAAAIKATGVMIGGAWKRKPDRAALKNSGVPDGVLISFKTNAAFEDDHGIEDTHAGKFYPVHTVMPGPIAVWDVEIVG